MAEKQVTFNRVTQKTLKRLPRFKGVPLASLEMYNYFDPVEVPREVCEKRGAIREVYTVNPLTGVIKVETYFAVTYLTARRFMYGPGSDLCIFIKWNNIDELNRAYPCLISKVDDSHPKPTYIRSFVCHWDRNTPSDGISFTPSTVTFFGIDKLITATIEEIQPNNQIVERYTSDESKDHRVHGSSQSLKAREYRVNMFNSTTVRKGENIDYLNNEIYACTLSTYSTHYVADQPVGTPDSDRYIHAVVTTIIKEKGHDTFKDPLDDKIVFYKTTIEFTIKSDITEYYELLSKGKLWAAVRPSENSHFNIDGEIVDTYLYNKNKYNGVVFDNFSNNTQTSSLDWEFSQSDFSETNKMVKTAHLIEFEDNDTSRPRVKETATSKWKDMWDWLMEDTNFTDRYAANRPWFRLVNWNPNIHTFLQQGDKVTPPSHWWETNFQYAMNTLFKNTISRTIPDRFTLSMDGWYNVFQNWGDKATTNYDVTATAPYLLNSNAVIENLYYNQPPEIFMNPETTRRFHDDDNDNTEMQFNWFAYQSSRRLSAKQEIKYIERDDGTKYKNRISGTWNFASYLHNLKTNNRKIEYYWWWSYLTTMAQGEIRIWYKLADYDYQGPIKLTPTNEELVEIIDAMKHMQLRYDSDAANRSTIANEVRERMEYIPRDHTCDQTLYNNLTRSSEYDYVLPNGRREDVIGIRTDNYNSGGLDTSRNRNTKPVNIMPIKKYHPDQACYGITHNVIEHAKRNMGYNPGVIKRCEILVTFHPWTKLNDRRAAAAFAIIDNTDGFTAPLYTASAR